MEVFNFSDFFEQLKAGVISLVDSSFKNYADAAKADGQKMLDEMKDKLDRWTSQLMQGNLTEEDFEWLLYSQKQLTIMSALKDVGIGQIEIDLFKINILNLIKNTAFQALKI